MNFRLYLHEQFLVLSLFSFMLDNTSLGWSDSFFFFFCLFAAIFFFFTPISTFDEITLYTRIDRSIQRHDRVAIVSLYLTRFKFYLEVFTHEPWHFYQRRIQGADIIIVDNSIDRSIDGSIVHWKRKRKKQKKKKKKK